MFNDNILNVSQIDLLSPISDKFNFSLPTSMIASLLSSFFPNQICFK